MPALWNRYFDELMTKGLDKLIIGLESFIVAILLKRIKSIHKIILDKIFVEQPDDALILMRDVAETGLVVHQLLFI